MVKNEEKTILLITKYYDRSRFKIIIKNVEINQDLTVTNILLHFREGNII